MTAFTYDHIHLRSPDAEATARWYENMFGAEVIRSVQSDGKPRLDLNLGVWLSSSRKFRRSKL